MAMQTDVKNVALAATGTLLAFPNRVKGMVITSTTAGAGSVILKDGGSGGTTLLEINVPATAAFHGITIPGEGVRFSTNVHATLANCSISVFYG
jgi:hypothetical protein